MKLSRKYRYENFILNNCTTCIKLVVPIILSIGQLTMTVAKSQNNLLCKHN